MTERPSNAWTSPVSLRSIILVLIAWTFAALAFPVPELGLRYIFPHLVSEDNGLLTSVWARAFLIVCNVGIVLLSAVFVLIATSSRRAYYTAIVVPGLLAIFMGQDVIFGTPGAVDSIIVGAICLVTAWPLSKISVSRNRGVSNSILAAASAFVLVFAARQVIPAFGDCETKDLQECSKPINDRIQQYRAQFGMYPASLDMIKTQAPMTWYGRFKYRTDGVGYRLTVGDFFTHGFETGWTNKGTYDAIQ
jgi:hypothetical protein